jgi:hypothetical protein
VRVVDVCAHSHAVMQDPLVVSSNFFCNAFASQIAGSDYDLRADLVDVLEGIACCQFCGSSGVPVPMLRGANPVA